MNTLKRPLESSYKLLQSNRNAIYLSIVAFVFIGSYVFFNLSDDNKNLSPALRWVEYSDSPTSPKGYLLELSDAAGTRIYIASDKEFGEESYTIAPDWHIEMITQGEVWNPRVCARMPVTITPNGDIFMLETFRNERNEFSSSLIRYIRDENALTKANIDAIRYSGKFFFQDENNQPYFFSTGDDALYKYTVDTQESSLIGSVFFELSNTETVTLARDADFLPVFKVFDGKNFVGTNYRYKNGGLEKFDEELPSMHRYLGDETIVNDLQHTVEAHYLVSGPYGTKILFEGEVVLEFKPEAQVFTYVIGSYKDSE